MLLTSTIGGLGAVVGLINYNIRCYNRFSYLIGAVAIIISMKMLQMICEQLKKKVGQKQLQKTMTFFICLFVLTIGILDQTTAEMAYSRGGGEAAAARYNNDKQFVESIEALEGENAEILVFPVMNGQESAIGYTKSGHFTGYNERMLFIQSSTSNWSVLSNPGEAGERWLNWLRNQDIRVQARISAAVDFSGIAVCYSGGATR